MNNQRDEKRDASSYGIDSQGSSDKRNQSGKSQQMSGEQGSNSQQRDRNVDQSKQGQQGREEADRKRTDDDLDNFERPY